MPLKSIVLVGAAMSGGFCFSPALARGMVFFAPPTDSANDLPPGPRGTLEEQLAHSNAEFLRISGELTRVNGELTTANGAITSLTTERNNLQGQFDSLTTTANQLRVDLGAANAQVTTLTATNADLTRDLTASRANETRLESLCGVNGIDPKVKVPPAGDGPSDPASKRADILEQLNKTTDPRKRNELANQLRKLSAEA